MSLRQLLLHFQDGVIPIPLQVRIVPRECLQVPEYPLSFHLHPHFLYASLYICEPLLEGVPILVPVVPMQLISVEIEVLLHFLIVEPMVQFTDIPLLPFPLLQNLLLFQFLYPLLQLGQVDLLENIAIHPQCTSLCQEIPALLEGLCNGEPMQSLSDGNQIVFVLMLIHVHEVDSLHRNLILVVTFAEFGLTDSNHFRTEVDTETLIEMGGKLEQELAGPCGDVQVPVPIFQP